MNILLIAIIIFYAIFVWVNHFRLQAARNRIHMLEIQQELSNERLAQLESAITTTKGPVNDPWDLYKRER